MSKPNLARRVAEAAEIALAHRKYVTFIDVVTGLRWLHSRHVDIWRQGRAATLAELAAVDDDRLVDGGRAAEGLGDWPRGCARWRPPTSRAAVTAASCGSSPTTGRRRSASTGCHPI